MELSSCADLQNAKCRLILTIPEISHPCISTPLTFSSAACHRWFGHWGRCMAHKPILGCARHNEPLIPESLQSSRAEEGIILQTVCACASMEETNVVLGQHSGKTRRKGVRTGLGRQD